MFNFFYNETIYSGILQRYVNNKFEFFPIRISKSMRAISYTLNSFSLF